MIFGKPASSMSRPHEERREVPSVKSVSLLHEGPL